MNIGIYYPDDNEIHYKYLQAMFAGLVEHGEDAEFLPLSAYRKGDVDLAVVFGIGKRAVPASMPRAAVLAGQKEIDRDTLVLERGYIKRNQYYSCGLNGINNRALFNNDVCPPDRFEALGVELKPWRFGGNYILLIGQVPWDASVQHTDHYVWLNNTVAILREFTQRPIVFRPHPLAYMQDVPVAGCETSQKNIQEDIEDAFCVVTFNSNSGVDAVIEGVPAFCADHGSMIYPHGAKPLCEVEAPPSWAREQWAANIAYAQWTADEMRAGLAWAHMKPLILDRYQEATSL